MSDTRLEKDSLGEIEVPAEALWGAQTQRAVDNFPISGRHLPDRFIQAVVRVKRCAANVNADLELLDDQRRRAIVAACDELLGGCLLYTSPSPRDRTRSRMPSSA